ncbi:uncharacterized protein N7483_007276 [Penicillium malachiteum]|uniref:uncharacterized protein n=1 Tax=Penicillium malachiteum TaxID=1324776 RepID=UPI0025484D1E|nr:uncharacterized protein N7483_007276 [Penicillium malachiteum]KAJ5725919.1 hypothetical protein N7483_007276 [Penicillium malachiteum]
MSVSFQTLPVEILFMIAEDVGCAKMRRMKDCSLTVCSAWYAVAIQVLYENFQLTAETFQRLASKNRSKHVVKGIERFTKRIDYGAPKVMGSNRHWHSNKGSYEHDRYGAVPLGPELLHTTIARSGSLRSFSVKFTDEYSQNIRLHDRYDLGLVAALRYCNLKNLEISTIEAPGWDEPVPCTAALSQLIARLDTVSLRMKYICPKLLEYICPLEFDPQLSPYPLIPGTEPTKVKYTMDPADVKLKSLTIFLTGVHDHRTRQRVGHNPFFSYRCGGHNPGVDLLQPMLDGAAALVQCVPTIEHLWVVGCFQPGTTSAVLEAQDVAKGVRRVIPPAVWQRSGFDVTANHLSIYNREVDTHIEEVE